MAYQALTKYQDSTSRLSAPDLEFVCIARGFTGKSQKQIISEALRLWAEAHMELEDLIPARYWIRFSDEPIAEGEAE